MAFGQSVLVVEHGLDELINDILAQILGSNESSLNGDADDIAGHAGIGGGGQVVTDQERIGLLNGGELFVSEGDEVEGVGGGVVDDSGRGSTGDGEGGIDLAVLELVNAILEGAVHRIDVVLGQTRSAEHLPGVDLGTGTNVTNADGLALEVGNGVDAGLGKDLNGLVVDTGNPQSVGLGSAVEGVGALVRVVDNVGLQNGHLSLAVGDHVDVRDGSAGGLNIEGGKGQLGVEDGLENAADSIVGTGGTAGRQSDRDGGIGAGVAVVVLAVVRLLTAAGDQREDHREREDQS